MTYPNNSEQSVLEPAGGKHVADLLKKLYILVLGLIASLTILGQVAIQPMLHMHEDDAAVINIAGRQRMLSQKLTKTALAVHEILDHCFGVAPSSVSECGRIEEYLDDLRGTLRLWTRSHMGLRRGDTERNLPGNNSQEVVALFEEIEPHYRAMQEAVETLLARFEESRPGNPDNAAIRPYVQTITGHESPYLTGMNDIVFRYEKEAQARVSRLRNVELGMALATLGLLLAAALALFAPAVRLIRTQFAQLDESKSRFRRAILDAPFPIMIHAEDGEVLQINKAWTELTGYAAQDIPTISDWTEKAYGKQMVVTQARIDRLYEINERVKEGEYEITTRGGEQITFDFSSASLGKLPDGRRLVISMADDVTERKRAEEAVRDSEARYRLLVETIPHGIQEIDTSGTITFANRAHCEIYGYSHDELLGKKIWDLEAHNPEELAAYLETLVREQPVPIPYKGVDRAKDGTRIDVQVDWNYKRDVAGCLTGFVSVITDITDRKLAEEALRKTYDELEVRVEERTAELLTSNDNIRREIAERKRTEAVLRESEERYRALFDQAPDAIVLIDAESKTIVEFNDRACEALGYTREEFRGLSIAQLEALESVEEIEKHSQKIIKEKSDSFETIHRTKNGELRSVLVRTSLISHRGKRFFQGIWSDITERKQAEESARVAAEIMDHMAEGVQLARTDTREIVYANPRFEQMFGYGPGELAGTLLTALNASGERSPEDTAAEIIRSVTKTGVWTGEIHNVKKDGTPFWCTGIVSIFEHSRYGTVWVTVQQDVTERKRAEEQLRIREAELAHASRLGTMGATVSGLAHELNQPLSAVSTYADACKRMVVAGNTNELVETLGKVAGQAERAGEIIHRVQRFVRKEAPHKSTADVNGLIREALDLVEMGAKFGRITVSLELSDTVPLLCCDAIQIQQVIVNLVQNALDAMRRIDTRKHKLTIQSRVAGDDVVTITVRDTGAGFDDEAAKRLFEPFFTTKSHGMGLGLSVSQTIVDAHGGRLWATPNSDRGATFHLCLPIDPGACNANR